MRHKRRLTILIAGVTAAALSDYTHAQMQTEGTVARPVEQAPPPVEETDFPAVAFFKTIASTLHLTRPAPVGDNGLPAFNPRTGALHHKHRARAAKPKSGAYAAEVAADRAEPTRLGPDTVTLSRDQYDRLRDLAAVAQAAQTQAAQTQAAQTQAAQTAAVTDQTLVQGSAFQDSAGQTPASNSPTTDSNLIDQNAVAVLKVALPATSPVTRPLNQSPGATGIPQLRRKMKREE